MSKASLSRRGLITAAIAIPAVSSARQAKAVAELVAVGPDPVIARAEEWIANNARVEALSVEADDLQGAVFDKARALGIRGDKACRSRMPEAREWRAKKQEYEEACRSLATLTGDIRKMRAVMRVIGIKPFWNVKRLEKDLHDGFAHCWYSGEWFELLDEGYRDTLIDGFTGFSDTDRDMNSVDFIYWMNGDGMSEMLMARSEQKLSSAAFRRQESLAKKR